MFVVSEQNKAPRAFQKPNILRKKPKCKEKPKEPAAMPVDMPGTPTAGAGPAGKSEGKHHCSKPGHTARKPTRIQLDSYMCEEYRQRKLHATVEAAREAACVSETTHPTLLHNVYEDETNLNVQLLLTSHILQEQYDMDYSAEQTFDQYNGLQENASYSIVESGANDRDDFTLQLAPYLTFHSVNKFNLVQPAVGKENSSYTVVNGQQGMEENKAYVVCVEDLPSRSDKQAEYAWEGCGKARGGGGGAEAAAACATRRVTLDCPARRRRGEPFLCEAVFQCRDHLVKHLKEDHTDEDAVYKCDTCQRSFFWFSGLRAHMRVHDTSARSVYACLWPDCGRVFLQACRLKEHSRQHTGDKPYPCLYPSCGWAFRTASKLVRHARRHTDERRFRCRLCPRAFLRAEHLREHEARHTHPLDRHKHSCTQPGCEQRFSNKSSLYLHTKKMHPPPLPPPPPPPPPVAPLIDFSTSAAELEYPGWVSAREEFHAARTHVTWPIAPGAHRGSHASPSPAAAAASDSDAPAVAAAAPRDAAVYADLFLHGDTILHRDDNQQCMELVLLAGEEAGGGGAGPAAATAGGGGYVAGEGLHLDADLGLLDSTADPINHLLQEELMLAADSCVDDSPFQVLLLSGDGCH